MIIPCHDFFSIISSTERKYFSIKYSHFLVAYGEYDTLEYSGIWLITVVMSIWGMSAALVAGVIAALSVFAAQSMTHQNPVRGAMSAKTLRSSRWNRPPGARAILDDDTVGRKKIFMIQLQGHVSHLLNSNVAKYFCNCVFLVCIYH